MSQRENFQGTQICRNPQREESNSLCRHGVQITVSVERRGLRETVSVLPNYSELKVTYVNNPRTYNLAFDLVTR